MSNMYLLTMSKGPPYLTKHTGSHVTKKERKRKQPSLNIVYTLYRFIFSLSSEKAIAGVWGFRERHLFSSHLFCARNGEREACVPHGEIPPRPHCRRLSLVLGSPLRPPAWQECRRRSVTVIECYEEGEEERRKRGKRSGRLRKGGEGFRS